MWRQGDTRVVPRDAVVEHNSCRFVLGNPPRLESLLLVQDQGPAEPIIAHGSPIADTDLASWFRNSSYTLGERSVRYEVLPIAVSPHPPVLHSAVRCNVAWVAASGAMGAACGVASASVAAIRGRDREAAQGVRGADVLAAGIVGCLMGSVGALAFGGLTWEHSIQVTLAPGFESGKRRISFSSPGSGSASECADSACVVRRRTRPLGLFNLSVPRCLMSVNMPASFSGILFASRKTTACAQKEGSRTRRASELRTPASLFAERPSWWIPFI